MFSMVVQSVFKATVGPIISDCLIQDDSYCEAFRQFDKGVIPLFNKAPSFLTRKARQARAYLLETLQSQEFLEQASPIVKTRQETIKNLSPAALSKTTLALIFGAVGNSAPALFWCLLHLLHNPAAWEACRAQVESILAKRQQDKDDITFTMADLDQMTLLESAFWETLRLYQGNFTARRVTEDFVMETSQQNYLLEKGTQLMPFWAVLHHDPAVFPNPMQFQYDRFVGANNKPVFTFASGATVNYWPVVAFGGGEHYCAGRKFIAYEARLYLAMLMLNFDMRLAEGETIPGIDRSNIGVGVCHPDREVKVEIRRRVKDLHS
eukprot:Sro508_g156750.2  (322) ;mRNA; r:27653-28618